MRAANIRLRRFHGAAMCVALGTVLASVNFAQAINVGVINFASTANGGTAVADPNGSNPGGGIDGILGDGPGPSATWGSSRIGAVWTGTLSPSAGATGSNVSEIRIYDRSCCTSYAPYTVELLNGANVPIYTNTTSTVAQRPATFSVPNVAGAAKVRVSYTGGAAGDAYVGEIEVIGFNGQVAGVNAIGSQQLASTITGSTSAGNLAGARVVELKLTETTAPLRADFAEFRVVDPGATNIALAGTAYQRSDTPAAGFGVQPGIDSVPGTNKANNIIDNNGTTFSDSVGGTGDFYGVILGATSTVSSVQLDNRLGCCGGQGAMQLQVYSDVARSNLIYDGPVSVSRTNGATTNLQFQLGGTAVAALTAGQIYTMDINATTNTSDLLSVRPLQSTSTQLTVAGDLVVKLLAGSPTPGQTYQLFQANTFSGVFGSITLPTPAEGFFWDTSNLLVNGTITFQAIPTPEPSTFALVGLGIAVATVRARRRRRVM